MRTLLIVWIAFGAVALAAEPVALVNGEPITREELDRATGLAEVVFSLYQQFPTFAQSLLLTEEGKVFLARYEQDVLEKLILRRIQLQEAAVRGLVADEDEVSKRTQDALAQVCAHYGLTEGEFAAQLLAQGYSIEQYRDAIAREYREKLLLAALKAALLAEIAVSDEEIQAYYDEDPGRFVDDNGQPLPLAEVRDRIAAFVRLDKEEAHWLDWLRQTRERAEVEINL